jgi:hypothetical protein
VVVRLLRANPLMKQQADVIVDLLQGEMEALQTYGLLLDALEDANDVARVRGIYDDHLRFKKQLEEFLEKPFQDLSEKTGAWGELSNGLSRTAILLGEEETIRTLKQGEEHGIKRYQSSLIEVPLLEPALKEMIREEVLPTLQMHLNELESLVG